MFNIDELKNINNMLDLIYDLTKYVSDINIIETSDKYHIKKVLYKLADSIYSFQQEIKYV